MDIVRREQREPFITADGSSIRELAGLPSGNAGNQSLAEAVVPAGGETIEHLHRRSEEIYLFTHGSGWVRRKLRCGPVTVSSSRRGPRTSSGPTQRSRWFSSAAAPPPIRTLTRCCSRADYAIRLLPGRGEGEEYAQS
jgi:hypothetical protein